MSSLPQSDFVYPVTHQVDCGVKENFYLVFQLEVLSKRESSNLTIALRVTSENFLTSAVEVLAEEKRFLEDTKSHFWKTTAYFLYNRQVGGGRA